MKKPEPSNFILPIYIAVLVFTVPALANNYGTYWGRLIIWIIFLAAGFGFMTYNESKK